MRMHHFSIAVLALLLAGCASTVLDPVINERVDQAHSQIELARQPAPGRQDPLEVTDSVWLGDVAVPLKSGSPLPDKWLHEDSIALRSDNPLGLNQLIGIISSQTHIPVRLTDGASELDSGASSQSSSPVPPGMAGAPSGSSAGGSSSGTLPPGMLLSFQGPLPDLLDMITSYFNVYWSYDGSSLTISRYQTRTFALDALPGSISVTAPSSTGATGAAAGSAQAQPLATANIDIWEDIRHTIADMVGQEGSVNISQSSGTVVVSTTGDRMERIAAFVQEENRRLSRQVAVTIELYTVSVTDNESYGLDSLNLALNMSGNVLDIGKITGVSSGADSAAGSMAFTILNPGAFRGTTGLLQALSTLGKATRVAQIPVTTLNNRPANQRIAVDQAYVSEVSSTTSADTVTTDVTTDTVTTGISVSILPRLMADNRILLQYALAQGALLQLKDFPAGSNTVQLPETQGLSFSQQVMLKDGATLVLAGFDQSDASSDGRGVGRPLTWALGGSTSSSRTRQIVVIAITPREIVVNRREAS